MPPSLPPDGPPAPVPGGREPGRAAGRWAAVDPPLRQQLPLFAAVGALSILAGLIPFPQHRVIEVLVSGVLFFSLTVLAVVVPWRRLPQWTWTAVPIGYLAVIALIRDAQGGSNSGLVALYFLPIVWLAFYGRRSQLGVGLVAMTAAVVVPMVVLGPPEYPVSGWRGALVTVGVAAVVSFSLLAMVTRERAHARDLAEQAALTRREAQQADEAREQLASILRAATGTAVVGSDREGLVTFFSAGAEHLLGYAAEEVVGQMTLYQFLHPDEPARRQPVAWLAANTGGPPWSFVRRDGSRGRLSAVVTAQVTRGPVVDGAPTGYVVVATDVTEREHLAAERERLLSVQREVTQALVEQNHQLRELTQMKDDVVATVSHELRTPLTSIRGYVELLMDGRGHPFDEEQAHMLRAIERNSQQLLHVADDLLEDPGLGRGLRVQFVDTDLAALAEEAVDAMAAAAAEQGITLSLQAPGPTVVHGDPIRLHQLLGNLLANAVKFTPAGGRAAVHVADLGQFVRLDVLDDGPGIPMDERVQLFDRFYRLASSDEQGIPGSGLGLAIARSVVEAHNGTIDIVDTRGWSTTFRIHLPAVEQHHGPLAGPPAPVVTTVTTVTTTVPTAAPAAAPAPPLPAAPAPAAAPAPVGSEQ